MRGPTHGIPHGQGLTSLAQVGAGYRDALFVVAGGIAGAMVYGYNDAAITAYFAESGKKVGFDQLLGVPFWLAAVILAAALAAVLVALEVMLPWRSELGGDVDGVAEPAVRGRLVAAE